MGPRVRAHCAHSFVGPKGPGPIGPILGDSFEEVLGLFSFSQNMSLLAKNTYLDFVGVIFQSKNPPEAAAPHMRACFHETHFSNKAQKTTFQKWVLRDWTNMTNTRWMEFYVYILGYSASFCLST